MVSIKRKIVIAMVSIAAVVAIIVLAYSDAMLHALVAKSALDQRANLLVNATDHLNAELNQFIHPAEHFADQVKFNAPQLGRPQNPEDLELWKTTLSPYVSHLFETYSTNDNLRLYFVDPSFRPLGSYLDFKDLNTDQYLDPPQIKKTQLEMKSLSYFQSGFLNKKQLWLPTTSKTLSDGSIKTYWHYLIPIYADERETEAFAVLLMSSQLTDLHLSGLKSFVDANPRLAVYEYWTTPMLQTEFYPNLQMNLASPLSGALKTEPSTLRTYTYKVIEVPEQGTYSLMTHVLTNGWHLTYLIPHSDLMKGFYESRPVSRWLAILFVLLILGIALRVADYIETPIVQLIHRFNTRHISGVFPNAPSDYLSRSDELGILVKTFDRLSTSINNHREMLKTLQNNLEQQATEKSTALRQTHMLLSTSIQRLAKQEEELERINHRLKDNLSTIADTRKRLLLTEKNESLKFLVSGVAHELNTPIGNTITLSTFLDHEYAEILEQLEQGTGLQKNRLIDSVITLNEAALHMSQNITQANEILDLIDTIIMTPIGESPELIVLSSFIENLFQSITKTISRPILLNITDSKGLTIMTDPAKLTAVIEPLIHNSLDHGFDNQDKPIISIELLPQDHGFDLLYADNGSGVNPHDLPHLFTPFFTTKFGAHKGLGLNLAYNVIHFYFLGTMQILSNPRSGLKIKCHFNLFEDGALEQGGSYDPF